MYAGRGLSEAEVVRFADEYNTASVAVAGRERRQLEAQEQLLRGVLLLGVAGIEDRLGEGVPRAVETLRTAGVRTWILSGDRTQTVQCVALSSRLVDPATTPFYTIEGETSYPRALERLQDVPHNACLVIDGVSLQTLLGSRPADYAVAWRLEQAQPEVVRPLPLYRQLLNRLARWLRVYATGRPGRDLGDRGRNLFVDRAAALPACCCCRCTPAQKALVAQLVAARCRAETAAVGDGANDVSLLHAASVGFGVMGREGRQAAMAADYAVGSFADVPELVLWHGRNSFRNTVVACQFVVQRGVCQCLAQAVFSAAFAFQPVVLYTGLLMLGYSVFYTIAPVLCMYLDEDADHAVALRYPELHQTLLKARMFSARSMLTWCLLALYTAATSVLAALHTAGGEFAGVVLVSFSALVADQLLLAALTVRRWTWQMVLALVGSMAVYYASLFV